jgi:protein archease
MTKDFELVAHTADLQLRVYGDSLPMLFKHALIGMFQAMEPHAAGCSMINERVVCKELPIVREISVSAKSLESLLVDFLSQALSLSDIFNEAYLDCIVHEIDDHHIRAELKGISIERVELEIKAVTYNNLAVKKINNHWQADIVFDI